jgi:hypothetical protein
MDGSKRLVVEHLLNMCEILSSVPSTTHAKDKKKKKENYSLDKWI